MGNAEREQMERRLAGMTDQQKEELLLQMAEGMRPGDDDAGRGRVQSADAILALRPKVEVWTLLPRTGRIDKRQQDRKVWDTPGVLDPMANEDMPDRPQIIKVIDMTTGETLFERDTVMSQPTPGQPVSVAVGQYQPGVQVHAMQAAPIPADPAALAQAMVALLRSDPELRRAVVEMADAEEGASEGGQAGGASGGEAATGLPPLSEADRRKTGPTGPTKRQRRQEAEEAAMAAAGAQPEG